jgi:hypothetical protein
MAHFAELDENNIVLRVCVVDNVNVPSDKHIDGETWCKNFWGGNWKQTSITGSFRKRFASIGGKYDTTNDWFQSPQPYNSWLLDSNGEWQPPKSYPDSGKHIWNESSKDWVEIE